MTTAISSITLDQLAGETVWLRRLAGSLVPNDAEDVVHDTLLVASERAPADRPLRPWLARVLVNRVRMLARSSSRRRKREEAVGQLATEPARPDEIVDRIKLHRLLAGYVLELAQAERDVVLLHYFEGLTSIEIGNRLGISAGTVRWRLKQAVDELRRRLDAESPNRAWVAPMLGLAKGSGAATTSVSSFVLAALAAIAVIVALLALPQAEPTLGAAAGTSQTRPLSAVSPTQGVRDTALRPPSAAPPVIDFDQKRIVGKVLDPDGRAAAGAGVHVTCRNYSNSSAAPDTTTAADGTFAFDIDRGCSFDLVATTDDATVWTNEWRHVGDALIVMTLQPAPAMLVRVVEMRSDLPLAGVRVWSNGMSNDDHAVTDSTGVARVRWVKPGTTVTAELAGYVPGKATIDDATDLATIRLARGIEVSGAVFDPDGRPVAGARTMLIGPVDREAYDWNTSVADAAGLFAASVPRPGRYRFVATHDGFGESPLREIDVGPEGRVDLVADLTRSTEITGTVVDTAGKPVAGARVRMAENFRKPVITDARGRFTMRNASGTNVLIAHHGDQASTWYPVALAPGAHAEVELRLGPGGVTGVVVDTSGHPLAHAEVLLNYCCQDMIVVWSEHTFTDDQGRFALDTPRGELRLSVRRSTDDDFLDDDDVHVQGGARDVRLVLP